MNLNKEWVKVKDRSSSFYVNGVDEFLIFALSNVSEDDKERATIGVLVIVVATYFSKQNVM